MLRKTFRSLSADRWGCVPALLVIWPEAPQCWSLWSVGWDEVLVRRWWPPGEFTPMSTPQNYCCQCLCLYREPQPLPASAGDPPVLAGSFVCVSCGVAAPSLWVLVHIPGLESVSCSPMEGLQSNPTGLQGQSPCGFPVLLLDSRLRSQTWGLEPSQQRENFCGIIVLQLVGFLPSR